MPDPNDPLDGYRPDMDQYHSRKDVHEEIDGGFRMLGYVIIGAGLAVVALLGIWIASAFG